MQSKTSFFNGTLFRKNLTRFAPAWGLYTLCLLLGLILKTDNRVQIRLAYNLSQLLPAMGVINMAYALITAQLLFGDLYSTRMCYSIHAMPVRRETLFVTNVVSGLLFSVIPTAIMTLVSLPLVLSNPLVNAWQIPLLFFVGSNLQYICFFGIACLCTFCAGNRVGMAIIYAMVNLLAALAYLFVNELLIPLLPGVILNDAPFLKLSPVMQFTNERAIQVEKFYELVDAWEFADKNYSLQIPFTLTPQWGYYWLYAAIGVVLMGVSLVMYRKRNLECAGDFLGTKWAKPVFLVLFTVAAGIVFQLAYYAFYSESGFASYIFLTAGLAVGWFVGLMLLSRSTRVFRVRNLPGLAGVIVAMALIFGFTYLDPMNIQGWVPQEEDVDYIYVSAYGRASGAPKTRTQEEIREVLELHRLALEQGPIGDDGYVIKACVPAEEVTEYDYRQRTFFTLCYVMKNGKEVSREYTVWVDSEAGNIAKKYFSRMETILMDSSVQDLVANVTQIERSSDYRIKPAVLSATPELMRSLFSAVEKDCENAAMAQGWVYHDGYFTDNESGIGMQAISLYLSGNSTWCGIDVFPDSVNTLQWLRDNGLFDDANTTIHKTGHPPIDAEMYYG